MIAGESTKLFERLWRDRRQIGEGKPFGAIICHINDPRPGVEAIERLSGYYKFTKANDWVTVNATEIEAGKERCRQLGACLARTGKQTKA